MVNIRLRLGLLACAASRGRFRLEFGGTSGAFDPDEIRRAGVTPRWLHALRWQRWYGRGRR